MLRIIILYLFFPPGHSLSHSVSLIFAISTSREWCYLPFEVIVSSVQSVCVCIKDKRREGWVKFSVTTRIWVWVFFLLFGRFLCVFIVLSRGNVLVSVSIILKSLYINHTHIHELNILTKLFLYYFLSLHLT